MSEEWEWWWAWSGAASGAWAAVVCVVVVIGSAVNVAVLVHWVTSRPTQDSPAAALHIVDLLMCILAAPLRYAHAPPIPSPETSSLIAISTPMSPTILPPVPHNSQSQQNANSRSSNIMLDDNAEVSVVNSTLVDAVFVVSTTLDHSMLDVNTSHNSLVLDINTSMTAEGHDGEVEAAGGLAHAAVVCVCLASLHVVVMVAVHRVALLLRRSSGIPIPPRLASPLFVLTMAVIGAMSLVGGLHATGQFTGKLPLLGVAEPRPNGAPPPALVVGFLLYEAGLCGTTTLCYVAIIAALLNQGRGRVVPAPSAPPVPRPPSCSSHSSVVLSPPEVETMTQGYGGHGWALRACMTVVSVLVTLLVCWVLPVGLALYALLTEATMTPALPYSDALLLLSGLVHPFVYGEGWAAVAACLTGLRHGVSTAAYRLGLTKKTRTQVRVANAQGEEHGVTQQQEAWCCWPCSARTRLPDTRIFSEVATFVNSFPLRHALSRYDPEQ